MGTRILEAAQEWIRDSPLEPDTLHRYVYSLGLLVRSGLTEIEQITAESTSLFLVERRKTVGDETSNRDLAAVSSFVRWLYEQRRFPLETLLGMRQLYRRTKFVGVPYFLTAERYEVALPACAEIDRRLELAVALDTNSGMRFSEMQRSHYQDYTLVVDRPFVTVISSKTGKPRTAPIPKKFADELLGRWGFDRGYGPVFPARKRRGEDLVSPYVHKTTFRMWLGDARKRAGFYWNWLTLRHTYASWNVQVGVSIAKVSRWLGNSIGVCYDRYAALEPGGDADIERGFARLMKP